MTISQEQRNKAAVVDALSDYGRDPSKVIAIASDSIVWTINAPKGFFPFAGTRRGKKAVMAALGSIAGAYKFVSYKVLDVAAAGDRVWARCELRLKAMPSGRPVRFTSFAENTFRGGKLVAYSEYFDTASVLLQEGRIKPDKKKYPVKPAHFRH